MVKERKQKNPQKSQKKLGVPPLGIIDNIIISKNEAWAYYIISEKPFDFLSSDAKVNLANQTMTSLASLCQTADKKVDCHLLISNQAFNPAAWEEQLKVMYSQNNDYLDDGFIRFIEGQADSLFRSNYRKRITYLGVKLFSRGSLDFSSANPLEFGFKEAVAAFNKSVASMFQFSQTEITPLEEKRLRESEEELYRTLSGSSFQAKRPTAEECLLTIKRRFYPAMPTPYLETNNEERIGLSDIVLETGGTVEVKPRWLKMTQAIDNQIFEGYRATLSFSKLPNEMYSPSPVPPFMYRASVLPFTINARFSLMPVEAMKKDLSRKKLEAEDEISNLVESGQRVNAGLKETMGNINVLEEDLTTIKQPWISGNYRITVEAETEQALKDIVSSLKQEYAEHDFVLSWTSGDQLNLFREEFPGGKLEINTFSQTTNLALLGIAGINYGGKAGDPVQQKTQFSRKKRLNK